ncbi:MAG: winged helix DNA-binding domain-containing protein, partial [Nocardioidaceae bacterium]
PLAMVEHLLGLQAQEPLPPYLSLAARLEGFDPRELSATLERRTTVRLLLMRGTIHLVTSSDAVMLRELVAESLTRQVRATAFARHCADIAPPAFAQAVVDALAEGPLTVRELGVALATRFPGKEPTHLANTARVAVAIPQVPPRGLWGRSGGPAYALLSTWVGREPADGPDRQAILRRYLAAFGPASTADFQTWSGLTGVRAVVDAMGDDLVGYRDEAGRELLDLPESPLADPDVPAPVRLLGKYDNLWLSHSGRDRVTPDRAKRERWMGSNGGTRSTIFVDGLLEGLWRPTQNGRVDLDLFRRLTRSERAELDAEVGRTEALLATPAT